jgi:hypothetical protein
MIDRGDIQELPKGLEIFDRESIGRLKETASHLIAGGVVVLRIEDASLIDPSLSLVKQETGRIGAGVDVNINFETYDFRETEGAKIVKALKKRFPMVDRGPEFSKKYKGVAFAFILADEMKDEDFRGLGSLVKWVPTIIVKTEETENYPLSVREAMGEFTDVMFNIKSS